MKSIKTWWSFTEMMQVAPIVVFLRNGLAEELAPDAAGKNPAAAVEAHWEWGGTRAWVLAAKARVGRRQLDAPRNVDGALEAAVVMQRVQQFSPLSCAGLNGVAIFNLRAGSL
ncbi:MAG TPA: hypothetical protein PLF11_03330 [Bacillota bacterium]|nr:hypothetical protein [Bacillota bacterium]